MSKLIGIFIIFGLLLLPSSVVGDLIEKKVTSSRGGIFSSQVTLDSDEFEKNENLRIKVGLYVEQFSGQTADIHDVQLAIKIEGGSYLHTDSYQSFAEIDKINYGVVTTFETIVPEDVPSSLRIYVRAVFREDVSLSVDPQLDTDWLYIITLDEATNFEFIIIVLLIIAVIVIGVLLYKRGKKKNQYMYQQPSTSNPQYNQGSIIDQTIFCKLCGTKTSTSAKFCINCGGNI